VSINRPRRIFRSALPRPAAKVLAAALGMVLMAAAGVSLAVLPHRGPSSALKPAASFEQFSVDPEHVAVVDGGTLLLGDRVVRLSGVEPPSHSIVCSGGDCGAAAANALASLVRNTSVVCRLVKGDESGRIYGVCQAGGRELNLAIVAAGWARAQDGASALKAAEQAARSARRGAWSGDTNW
jgi:endonuclease YncB( thermonuclease family)